jgi:uncharacterized membrane protein YkvA (DUF1232 family)
MDLLKNWKTRTRALKRDTYALYLAYRDPRTPWYAKAFTVCVLGYAFSPLDLIPDFVPVLGYLDDVLLVPLGVLLAIKLIPPEVLAESRVRAQEGLAAGELTSRFAAVVIVLLWLLALAVAAVIIYRLIGK